METRTKEQSIKRLRSLSRKELHKLSEEFILSDSNKVEVYTWAIILAVFSISIFTLFN